jgi:hypothetical protein
MAYLRASGAIRVLEFSGLQSNFAPESSGQILLINSIPRVLSVAIKSPAGDVKVDVMVLPVT